MLRRYHLQSALIPVRTKKHYISAGNLQPLAAGNSRESSLVNLAEASSAGELALDIVELL
jgi:hypothetical protein